MIDPNDPSIPSVGQAFQVVVWYPTTVITCKCKPDGLTLLILTGFQNLVACPHCQMHYKAVGLTQGSNPQVVIESFIRPTPESEFAMTCPHCGNSDHSMIEDTGRTRRGGLPIACCQVCSREFEGDDEDDDDEEAETLQRRPPSR